MYRLRLVVLPVVLLAASAVGWSQPAADRDVVFQTSTLQALMEGVYDGEVTFDELRKHGDVGIGTFNALDGEMIGVDGKFFRIRADGVAYPVPDESRTPFAVVTFFDADETIVPDKALSFAELTEYLDGLLPAKNIPYAVKITGVFSYIKTRSVPAQDKPYPRLVEVVKHQPTFEFTDVRGTIVGFRLPKYMEGLNVPGYHLHFITQDRQAGGHLLECVTDSVTAQMDASHRFYLVLPQSGAFIDADIGGPKAEEVRNIEK